MLVLVNVIFTILSVILFVFWAVKEKAVLIFVDWGLLKERFYENLVFGLVITMIIVWAQILLQLLLQLILQT
ncbi:hypothetical protein PDN50_28360 [Bacillus cereus]|nr:hypothetical protein [Bacillus cereus]MDA2446415.1 hypothetical protein [Bacillus cereus]